MSYSPQPGAASNNSVEALNLYRLVPVAREDDPRWVKDAPQGIVLVAARTAGDARLVASESQPDFPSANALPAEDVTTRFASAFRDEKLYTVIEVETGRTDLTRGVISQQISPEPIKPQAV